MEHRVRVYMTNAAWVLSAGAAVSLISSTFVAARAYRARGEQSLAAERTIYVKGSTRRRIRSDRAVWQITVEGEAADLKAAFVKLDDAVGRVRTFLEQRGFGPAEIGLAAIDTRTYYQRDSYGKETRQVAGYVLSRTFVVTTADVDKVCQAAGQVTTLIKDGVHVISHTPEYYYTRLADLKVALMGAATADARRRAEQIAANAGCAVGAVRSARMGVLQITRPESMEVSSYGIYDTSTIAKDVRAVVTVRFGIVFQK